MNWANFQTFSQTLWLIPIKFVKSIEESNSTSAAISKLVLNFSIAQESAKLEIIVFERRF